MNESVSLSQEPLAQVAGACSMASDSSRCLELAFPLPRTHTGFALGNGLLGALVWGRERLHVTLDRSDYWDHRDGGVLQGQHIYQELVDQFDAQNPSAVQAVLTRNREPVYGDFCNTRLPVGRFELTLQPGYHLHTGRLLMDKGLLVITAVHDEGHEEQLLLAIHPQWSVLRIDDPAGVLSSAKARPAWEWVGKHLVTRGYTPPSMLEEEGKWGWTQDGEDQQALPRLASVCHLREGCWVLGASVASDIDVAREALQRETQLASRLDEAGWFGEVMRWWEGYWRDLPVVRLPDAFFDRFLNLALYKFAAATSPASPMPCALQGPWCEEYRLPVWCGDYHFNVNIQQIYTLAFSAGKSEHLKPLFAMLDRCMPVFRANAKALVGIDDGIVMPHAMDDQGHAAGGISAGAVLDQAVTGWTAQLYWRYYQHTGDVTFLREKAMPFMTGCMKVYQAMLRWEGDVPSLPVSISAEYGVDLSSGQKQRCGPDPSNQVACMLMLLEALIHGAQVLGVSPDPDWLMLQEKIPRWTLIGPADKQRIAIWKGQDLDVSHRHHSHLACVYPFDTLPHTPEPEVDAILANTVERWLAIGMSDWSEWSLPWAAIIQARLGYRDSPALLLKLCRDLYINEGWANVYLPRFRGFSTHAVGRYTSPLEAHEVMQLDGTMGIATALHEMLVHLHRGVIRFFPAIPQDWRDVSFEGIHLPGQIMVSGQMVDGEVAQVQLRSAKRQEVIVDLAGYTCLQFHGDAQGQIVSLPARMVMEAGETIIGRPLKSTHH